MTYFNSIRSLTKSLKANIPNRCVICDGYCNELICQRCYSLLEGNTNCCVSCAEPLPIKTVRTNRTSPSDQQCGQCLTHPPLYNKIISPLLYANELRQLIIQFKFTGNLALADFFAKELTIHLSNEFKVNGFPNAIIPIPLHSARLKQRGYNQAQRLGQALANNLGIPLACHTLKRDKYAEPQTGLNKRQRVKNIKGAFTLSNPQQNLINYSHILLVDDVITTGATLNEACRVLIKAHPKLIITACSIARSPAFS